MPESISFDRAAGYYDQSRAYPQDVMERLIPMLVEEVRGLGSCLEIGIGTGRIALPLLQAGVHMVGVDISAEMLRRLLEKAGASAPPVAIADATHLPFRDATFGSAVAAHVLHLIPGWRSAIGELARVMRPGGVLIASRGGTSRTKWQNDVRRHFFAAAGDPAWPPGIKTIDDLDAEMRVRSAVVRDVFDIRTEGSASINQLLESLEGGIWSSCWSIDDETRRRAAAATREWARAEIGDLDAARPTLSGWAWRSYALV